MDSTFLKNLLRYVKFMGLSPWYYYTSKTSFNYTYLVVLIELLVMITNVYVWKNATVFPKASASYYIFPFCELVTLTVFLFVSYYAAIRFGSYWTRLLKNCKEIDRTLSQKGLRVDTITTHLIVIILFNIYYTISFTLGFLEKRNITDKFSLFYTLIYMFHTYKKLMITVLTNLLTSILEKRYVFSAILLKRMYHSNYKDVKCTLKEVEGMMELLKECTDCVNVIIGSTSFALILHSFAAMLDSYDDLREFWEHPSINSSMGKAGFAYFCQRLFICILWLSIINGCERVELAHYEILNVCNELRTHIRNFTLRDDLIKFYKHAKVLSPKFTAVGFFRLERKLFLPFLSVLITYFIFIGQLYSSWNATLNPVNN